MSESARVVLVVDTTEIWGDYSLKGNSWSQLFSYLERGVLRVYIPEIVVREVERHFKREVIAADKEAITRLREAQQQLGRLTYVPSIDVGGLRREITERAAKYGGDLRQELSRRHVQVRQHPDVSHEVIADWAISERQPFKESGEGYRDSLTWATVLEIAAEADSDCTIAIVSDNVKDFGDGKGNLGASLLSDVAKLAGPPRVVLMRSIQEDDAGDVALRPTTDHELDPAGDEEWPDEDYEPVSVTTAITRAVAGECADLPGSEINLIDHRGEPTRWAGFLPQELETVNFYSVDPLLDTLDWQPYEELGEDVVLGKAEVRVAVEFSGFMSKADYYPLAEELEIEVLDGDHNDHYMWVTLERQLLLVFDVRIDTGSNYVEEVEFDGPVLG